MAAGGFLTRGSLICRINGCVPLRVGAAVRYRDHVGRCSHLTLLPLLPRLPAIGGDVGPQSLVRLGELIDATPVIVSVAEASAWS